MEFLEVVLNLTSGQIIVAGLSVLAFFAWIGGETSDTQDDQDDDYEQASWNPASVNYNE